MGTSPALPLQTATRTGRAQYTACCPLSQQHSEDTKCPPWTQPTPEGNSTQVGTALQCPQSQLLSRCLSRCQHREGLDEAGDSASLQGLRWGFPGGTWVPMSQRSLSSCPASSCHPMPGLAHSWWLVSSQGSAARQGWHSNTHRLWTTSHTGYPAVGTRTKQLLVPALPGHLLSPGIPPCVLQVQTHPWVQIQLWVQVKPWVQNYSWVPTHPWVQIQTWEQIHP